MKYRVVKKFLDRIKKSEFIRHVGLLARGSFLAQILSLGAMPFLTRLYGPESFAALALFIAIGSSIAPAITGRFELAIVVSRDKNDDNQLIALSLSIALIVSLLIFSTFICYPALIKFFNAQVLAGWWLMIPLSIFFSAVITTLNCYANRQKDYALIGNVMVFQALVTTSLSLCLGWLNYQNDGLLLSTLLGTVCGSSLLIYVYRETLNKLNWRPSLNAWSLAWRYRQFPIFNAAPAFIDALTIALPVFFLAKFYPENIVGYYALLNRAANTPLNFISQAVSQVHMRKVADQVRDKENSVKYLLHLAALLSGMVLVPTIGLIFFAPPLFEWVFGTQWRLAGDLLVILMPAFAVRFVVSTLSGVFASTGNNHLAAIWKVIAFVATLLLFWICGSKLSINNLFMLMMILDLVLYGIYFCFIMYAVKNPGRYK